MMEGWRFRTSAIGKLFCCSLATALASIVLDSAFPMDVAAAETFAYVDQGGRTLSFTCQLTTSEQKRRGLTLRLSDATLQRINESMQLFGKETVLEEVLGSLGKRGHVFVGSQYVLSDYPMKAMNMDLVTARTIHADMADRCMSIDELEERLSKRREYCAQVCSGQFAKGSAEWRDCVTCCANTCRSNFSASPFKSCPSITAPAAGDSCRQ